MHLHEDDLDNDLKFRENLPKNCPLPDSIEEPLTDVWRFLAGSEVVDDSFDSHAAKGKPCPEGQCSCRWASCSLFEGDKHTAAMMKLQPYKRFKARAKLTIPAGSGRVLRKNSHIDFWAYASFDFAASVEKVEQNGHQ